MASCLLVSTFLTSNLIALEKSFFDSRTPYQMEIAEYGPQAWSISPSGNCLAYNQMTPDNRVDRTVVFVRTPESETSFKVAWSNVDQIQSFHCLDDGLWVNEVGNAQSLDQIPRLWKINTETGTRELILQKGNESNLGIINSLGWFTIDSQDPNKKYFIGEVRKSGDKLGNPGLYLIGENGDLELVTTKNELGLSGFSIPRISGQRMFIQNTFSIKLQSSSGCEGTDS